MTKRQTSARKVRSQESKSSRPDPSRANIHRRRAVGAEIVKGLGAHFRVWAPRCKSVELVLDPAGRSVSLESEGDGYFSVLAPEVEAGSRYRFRLDHDDKLYPDPASRFQPEGPHGPSEVIDSESFQWRNGNPAIAAAGMVVYELHIGTFTREGTWKSAIEKLRELAELGITLLEVMPVHEFPGRFGWGYDGVDLWAPFHHYGSPDDFRSFVDAAHGAGLGVILDVVYNHLGPDGNYLKQFSLDYFTDRYPNDWGESINFDGHNAASVREFFRDNAGYWIEEFRLDGLRLDATQSIIDMGPEHVLGEISSTARRAAGDRAIFIVAENEEQRVRLLRPLEQNGCGLDAMWNDDFHHSAMVALTGSNPAYYTDYCGSPQEMISALKWGFLFQGQRYKWQKQRRGTPSLDIAAHRFVWCLENHDQVANSAWGSRLRSVSAPGKLRAMTALLLLSPATPMLFQGEEFGSSARFVYFADHVSDLAAMVAKGRGEFLNQFPALATPEIQARIPPPEAWETFAMCKLDWDEGSRNESTVALYRDLLEIRRTDPLIRRQRADLIAGSVLGTSAFMLRYFAERKPDADGSGVESDRLLLVNLGQALRLDPAPEPLLAPPEDCQWQLVWSSESVRYGGGGTPPIESEENWFLPGQTTLLLTAVAKKEG